MQNSTPSIHRHAERLCTILRMAAVWLHDAQNTSTHSEAAVWLLTMLILTIVHEFCMARRESARRL